MKEKHLCQLPLLTILSKQISLSWPTKWGECNHTRVTWCPVLFQVRHSKYQLLPEYRYMQEMEEAMLNVYWSKDVQLKFFLNKILLFNLFSPQPHSADGQNKIQLPEDFMNEALWNATKYRSFTCEKGRGSTCRPEREHACSELRKMILQRLSFY